MSRDILTKESIKNILASRFSEDQHTKLSLMPKPNLFKDIQKATKRIQKAYENGENILIVGDYDADGVIASVILSEFFDQVGIKYSLYIPNRFNDGYGLNTQIIENAKDIDLVITVDNGITANEATQKCLQKGIDLIITDHHNIPERLPEAFAIINPKQSDCTFPCKEICGAQVAWYLCASIKDVCKFECDLSYWLDILAIAIMADMMELKDLNRIMVKTGINKMNNDSRFPLMVIKNFFNKKSFQSDDISFLIAPLINSTGRMEDAMLSYRFLRSRDYDEAMEYLKKIVALNDLRKTKESSLFESSLEMVDETKDIIVVWGKEWHEGVIGIVASRLSRRFSKPAIVFSIEDKKAKGSVRSVGEIDILSVIAKCKELLLGFGGHKSAAGLSIDVEKLPAFKNMVEDEMAKIDKELFLEHKDILGELDPEEIDFELLDILKFYEPYGEKNPKPNFIIKDIRVKANKLIGKDQNHLKIILNSKNKTLESLFFNYDKDVKRGDFIDIVFTVSKNDYRGLVTPQLLIKEIL